MEALVPEGIKTIDTPALWKKFYEQRKKGGLIQDEILINVGSVSDDESSDEEVEPDDDDLQCLQSEYVCFVTFPCRRETML